MKNGKRPTRKEKELMQKYGVNPENWLVVKRLNDRIVIVHREVPRIKELERV